MGLAAADLMRLATAGSVDDGKSTLIGRLLFDSKQVLTDQLEHVEEASRRRGAGMVDLSLLVDGLRAEREQGITIDVAYRYFATPRRKFIVADTPGHEQYTRNMVTGASTADLALILVDARKGCSSSPSACLHLEAAGIPPRGRRTKGDTRRLRGTFDATSATSRLPPGWTCGNSPTFDQRRHGDNVVGTLRTAMVRRGAAARDSSRRSPRPQPGRGTLPVQWVIRDHAND